MPGEYLGQGEEEIEAGGFISQNLFHVIMFILFRWILDTINQLHAVLGGIRRAIVFFTNTLFSFHDDNII